MYVCTYVDKTNYVHTVAIGRTLARVYIPTVSLYKETVHTYVASQYMVMCIYTYVHWKLVNQLCALVKPGARLFS